MRNTRNIVVLAAILVGAYITAQVIADIAAVKLLMLGLPWGGSLVLPAGTFVFAFTFTLKDFIQKRLGKEVATAAVWMAVAANIAVFLYMKFAVVVPAAPFWDFQSEFATVYNWLPRIVLASILADLVSETVDGQIYDRFRDRLGPMGRIVTSNLVSIPLDSIVFELVAFAGILPFSGIVIAVAGQSIIKMVLSLIVAPATYLIKDEVIEVFQVQQSAAAAD